MLKKYLSYRRGKKLAKKLQEICPDGIKITIVDKIQRNESLQQLEIDVPCYFKEDKLAILLIAIWNLGVYHRINLSAENLDDQIYGYKIYINLEDKK